MDRNCYTYNSPLPNFHCWDRDRIIRPQSIVATNVQAKGDKGKHTKLFSDFKLSQWHCRGDGSLDCFIA